MPHSQLLRSNQAQIHYTRILASAYNRFIRLWDPDYASANDVEAWDKIRRDAVIYHAIQRRQQAVAGIEWTLEPASDDKQDKRSAEIVEALLRNIRRFHQARTNLAEAIFRGSSWAFIEGERREFKPPGSYTRRMWVPTFLRHVDRWRFQIRRDPERMDEIATFWEMFSLKTQNWERLENPEWFIHSTFNQTEETLGYGRGLLNSIYFYHRAKETVLAQGLAGLERWAQGFLTVGVDGTRVGSIGRDNDTIVDEYLDEITKHRSEHVFVHDKNDAIQVINGPGQGHQMVTDWLDYLDRSLNQLILTSVLPTGGGGEVGSLARAETEANQMEATFQADRMALSEDLTDCLVALVWHRNKASILSILQEEGIDGHPQMPSFKIVQQVKQDLQVNANVAITLLNGGVPLSKREVYERTGWTMPSEDEEVFEPPQRGAGGLAGLLGGQQQGGGLPFSDRVQTTNGNGVKH